MITYMGHGLRQTLGNGEYSRFPRSIGFVHGQASLRLFVHKARNIDTSVHGDDFTSAAPKVELDWLQS